jgi:hypothetical protein
VNDGLDGAPALDEGRMRGPSRPSDRAATSSNTASVVSIGYGVRHAFGTRALTEQDYRPIICADLRAIGMVHPDCASIGPLATRAR